MLSAKRFSALAIGLIAALIISFSTFTLAFAQHMQRPDISHPGTFQVGHSVVPIFIDPNDHIHPSNTPPDIHGLAGHK